MCTDMLPGIARARRWIVACGAPASTPGAVRAPSGPSRTGIGGRAAGAVSAAIAVAVVLAAACTPDRPPAPGLARGIDAVFADMRRAGSPGAQLAVIQDGEITFSRGYGEAQIEHGVRITPRTVFHVASVSKQFTAMAVTMLAARGALSLDDPVRKHLSYVPLFPHRVTVRQMIHHTSGIRDQWQLLALSGWRLDDVITTDQILGLMERQRELNFEPGAEYLYSNRGYTLLGEVAAAVSGMSFVEFTESEIFAPLGMTRTHFHDDHRHVVADRAYSYAPLPAGGDDDGAEADDDARLGAAAHHAGFTKSVLSYANAGATSLFTTAEDLARWLDNFRHHAVGGAAVMAAMQTRGVLADGDTIPYAHGLIIGEHRGLRTVGHSGGDAGFRTQATWYPDANTGVVVLANVANGNPGGRARQVAEIVLADLFAEQEEEGEEGGAPPAAADSEPPESPGPVEPAGYEGTYYSPELDAIYHLRASGDGGLVLHHVRHGGIALRPRPAPDEFLADAWFMRNVRFERGAGGAVTSMRVGGGRVRNLLFVRLAGPYGGRPGVAGSAGDALRALASPLPGDEVFPAPADTAALLADPPFVIPERPFAVPTGPHPIGTTEYRWTDPGRPERFTRDPADRRSVAVRVWYPAEAEPAEVSAGALYVADLAEFGANQEFVPVTHVRTNAVLGAAPARGPFPVLVYNHGGGWSRFTSTFTTEEMASHGYVVVSVEHNGFNRTQLMPDGSSVVPDTLILSAPPGEDLYAESMASFAFLDEHYFPEWVADAGFVLDRLEALNGGGDGQGNPAAGGGGADARQGDGQAPRFRGRPRSGACRHVRLVLRGRDVDRDERGGRARQGGGQPRRTALRRRARRRDFEALHAHARADAARGAPGVRPRAGRRRRRCAGASHGLRRRNRRPPRGGVQGDLVRHHNRRNQPRVVLGSGALHPGIVAGNTARARPPDRERAHSGVLRPLPEGRRRPASGRPGGDVSGGGGGDGTTLMLRRPLARSAPSNAVLPRP